MQNLETSMINFIKFYRNFDMEEALKIYGYSNQRNILLLSYHTIVEVPFKEIL